MNLITLIICLRQCGIFVPKFIWYKIFRGSCFEFNLEACMHLTPNQILVGACTVGNRKLAFDCMKLDTFLCKQKRKKNKGIIAAIKNKHFDLAAEIVEVCRNISQKSVNAALKSAPSFLTRKILMKHRLYRFTMDKDLVDILTGENHLFDLWIARFLFFEHIELGNKKKVEEAINIFRYFINKKSVKHTIKFGRIGILKLFFAFCSSRENSQKMIHFYMPDYGKCYHWAKKYKKEYIAIYIKKKYALANSCKKQN